MRLEAITKFPFARAQTEWRVKWQVHWSARVKMFPQQIPKTIVTVDELLVAAIGAILRPRIDANILNALKRPGDCEKSDRKIELLYFVQGLWNQKMHSVVVKIIAVDKNSIHLNRVEFSYLTAAKYIDTDENIGHWWRTVMNKPGRPL